MADASSDLCNLLEISIECRDLKNKDTFSKSDPLCVVLMKQDPADYVEVGRTEVVTNNLNPKFTTTFRVKFYFERRQTLRFEVYDSDSSSQNLSSHDKLGYIEVSLAEIVQGTLQKGKLLTDSGNKSAKIFVTARQTVECREIYSMTFMARGLDNKDFFGKSDPYLVFYKQVDNKYVAVDKTEVVKNNLNPVWAPKLINCATFNNKDSTLPIKIECYDYDNDGSSDFIGDLVTTSEELFKDIGQKTFPLINHHKKAKKKSYENSGVLMLRSFTIEEECEFLYYIQAGLQLSFIVAIDFTASNGAPHDMRSLHYFNPQYPMNQYMTAITSVGNVIQEYDSDKLFPVFGFGGRFFHSTGVSHSWPLNNNLANPHVCGVNGILDAYKYALSQSSLAGPTNFEDTVKSAAQTASQYQTGMHYFVLLIITDGAITDLYKTIDAIVEASFYPLSIIIVGVGDADFDGMEELDSDKHMLISSIGKVAQRDIVQFVALRDVLTRGGGDANKCQAKLASEVLAEIPRQVKNYLKPKGVYPSTVHTLSQQALNQQTPTQSQ